ncbi:hypothetical protein ACROYT_G009886 [Oculina patagonica]
MLQHSDHSALKLISKHDVTGISTILSDMPRNSMQHAILVLFVLCFHISVSADTCKPDTQPLSKCQEWKEGGYCTGSYESSYYMNENCYATCHNCEA